MPLVAAWRGMKTPSSDLDLQELVVDELAGLRRRLGGRLCRALDELGGRLGLEAPDQVGYFFRPFALPILELPGWTARAAERRGAVVPDEAVEALRRSALAGYLHVRVQDDLLDEGQGRPHEAMLLAEAFFARHQALAARAVGGDPRYWALFEERWLGYGEAMLLEAELLRGRVPYDRVGFEAVLRRSQPLVLPAAAVLAVAERWGWLEELETFVRRLATGHQLFHDLLHAEKDLRAGARTYVARRLSADDGLAALRRRTFVEGGFDEIVAEAEQELDGAAAAARGLGMDEAADHVEERRRAMGEVQREAFAALLARILATPPSRT